MTLIMFLFPWPQPLRYEKVVKIFNYILIQHLPCSNFLFQNYVLFQSQEDLLPVHWTWTGVFVNSSRRVGTWHFSHRSWIFFSGRKSFEYLFVILLNVLNTSCAMWDKILLLFSNVWDVTMAAGQDARRPFQLNFENSKFSRESQSFLEKLAVHDVERLVSLIN